MRQVAVRVALLVTLLQPITASAAVGQLIRGKVTREGSGEPVAGASVTLFDETEVVASRAETDQSGAYELRPNLGGGFWIRVDKPGFRPLESKPFAIARADSMVMNFTTAPLLTMLEEVTVTARNQQTRNYTAFIERQRFGYGRFRGPDDLERMPLTHLSSRLVGMMPGLQYDPARDLMMVRGRGWLGASCIPPVFVDGEATGESRLRFVVPVDLVRAIEVYRDAADIPSGLNHGRNSRCGAIYVWTVNAIGEG